MPPEGSTRAGILPGCPSRFPRQGKWSGGGQIRTTDPSCLGYGSVHFTSSGEQTEVKMASEMFIIIDSQQSVFNTDASMPYNHDLFESLIVKKRVKMSAGWWPRHLLFKVFSPPVKAFLLIRDDRSILMTDASTHRWFPGTGRTDQLK
ncbi:hypothetical protein T265_00553 [Opisthorchis viverrini]|uniref:Uncharacterized protein n=1 Tax=Opisthorchis viverrini TaxID=6198 RepID=A0A075ACM9_OPIVI|nr:hypothetical protein T265_00553 [Opisthorchis viverrini]KER33670.1 hypothetical protein T265_00553 [Opisthorchis viverrini]